MRQNSSFQDMNISDLHMGEVLSALSHALDLTEGQPPGHCMRVAYIGTAIGAELGIADEQATDLFYTLMLKDLGCSSNAARICQLFLTDDINFKQNQKIAGTSIQQSLAFLMKNAAPNESFARRLKVVAGFLKDTDAVTKDLFETRCQQGHDIALSMGFSEDVANGIACLDEHWDGGGHPIGAGGDDIPLFSQIALISQVIDVFNTSSGKEAALREINDRSGKWFAPDLVEVAKSMGDGHTFWDGLNRPDLGQRLLASQFGQGKRPMTDEALDRIVDGFAKVIDAKSPFTHGHSTRVALYSDLLAEAYGYDDARRKWLQRTALLHDIGKLGISNKILDKPGGLSKEEYASVKQHPVLSEQILSRVTAFQPLARIALAHHERLDGKGYPHGIDAADLSLDMRILTVADIFDALSADRPYRKALPLKQAFTIMDKMCGSALDGEVVRHLKDAIAGSPALEFAASA
ncbi:MAG: HD domain-containing protein [Silicimonas sp.]|nr:HD domain-containing protein [Silicimonas sp.]